MQEDWNLGGKTEHFYPTYAKWNFEWLDCAAVIRNAEQVLEYPMVDRDPLPYWTRGPITLALKVKKGSAPVPKTGVRALWVPAFAGTTG